MNNEKQKSDKVINDIKESANAINPNNFSIANINMPNNHNIDLDIIRGNPDGSNNFMAMNKINTDNINILRASLGGSDANTLSPNIVGNSNNYNASGMQNKINNNPNINNALVNSINNQILENDIPPGKRNKIFFMFLLANILLNYDTGVIPASLLQILKEIDLNFKEQALLGSLVYLGLSFASLFVGLLFAKYGPAKTCAVAILINTISCFLFSFSDVKMLLFFCRFLMGISEAFIVIYGPVWVNNYSPKEHSAKWMGILHSVTALGVMIGYVCAGIVINFFSHILSWRFAIQIQGFAQIPVALFFFFEKEEYINVDLSSGNNLNLNNNLNTISEIDDSINYRYPERAATPDLSNLSRFDPNVIANANPSGIKEMKKIDSKKSKFNNVFDAMTKSNQINNNNPNNTMNSNIFKDSFSQNIAHPIAGSHNYNNNTDKANMPINQHNLQNQLSNSNININLPGLNPTNYPSAIGNQSAILQTKFSKTSLSRIRKDNRVDAVETNNLKKYCSQVYQVMSNPLYITTTMALCSIYFIVTGIQFWMTNYLIDILGNDPILVVVIFSTVSITAPLGGVIVGGTFADAYGGYRGKNTLKALKLCSAFGVVAFIFAFPIGFLYSLIYITVLLWTFLFFGAAIVPVSTGIMVSSVRRDCQATSSSFSQLIFNLLGYFLAPILTGVIMDLFENKEEGYKWGMRVIFWWSIFASIFMSLAWLIAIRKYKQSSGEDSNLVLESDIDQNIEDLMKIEINRRMAQNKVL